MNLKLLIPSTWNPLEAWRALLDDSNAGASQALSDLFITSTVYLAVAFLSWSIVLTLRSIYQTFQYRKALYKVKDYSDFLRILQTKAKYKLPLFNPFKDHLVEIPLLDGSGKTELRRSVDAAEIFTDDALAPGLSSSRIFQVLPGILTGLGVLGTFVGLQLGIGGLKLQDLRELEKNIVPLIEGCAVAFSTSVWGVGTSLIFSFIEKILEGFALGGVRKLQSKVNQHILRYVPEKSMAGLERSSKGSEELLKGLAVAIGEEMQKAIGRLGSEIKDAVTNATREGQGPLAEQSAQLLSTAITAELSKLKDSIDGMGQRFSDNFTSASNELMRAVQCYEPMISNLAQVVSSTQSTVNNAVEKLNGHEFVLEKMADAAEKIHQAATSFTLMNETLETSASRNKDAAEAQHAAAAANLEVVVKLGEIGNRLPEVRQTIEEAARVIGSLGAPLNELQTLLAKQPELHLQIEGQRAASEEERSARLIGLSKDLAETVGKAVEEFSKIGSIAEQLGSASTSLEEASNELAVFGQQVLKASKEQRDASEASQAAARTNERVVRSFELLPAEFSKLTGGLHLAGEKLKEGSESAATSYSRLIEFQKLWLQGAETGLKALRDQVQEIIAAYGNRIELQTQNLMNQWTQQVTDCLKSYENQVQTLEGSLDELQDAISNLPRNA